MVIKASSLGRTLTNYSVDSSAGGPSAQTIQFPTAIRHTWQFNPAPSGNGSEERTEGVTGSMT